jgi:hypothetical protein
MSSRGPKSKSEVIPKSIPPLISIFTQTPCFIVVLQIFYSIHYAKKDYKIDEVANL